MTASPETIISFWRAAGRGKWFKKSDVFDTQIRDNFLDTIRTARAGNLDDWINAPASCLALIILLDQFPRNIFRGTPEMFASDAAAVSAAKQAIDLGHDAATDLEMRAFIYMPFMHSEVAEVQALSVTHFTALGVPANLKHALEHAAIVERFGRFPHRNAALGRTSTPDEIAFLADGGFAG